MKSSVTAAIIDAVMKVTEYRWTTDQLRQNARDLRAGDRLLLSGVAYTARDAAHKRILQALKDADSLPFTLTGAVIYYAGPTPAPIGRAIGSCGPTTSLRMDPYTPALYDLGVIATIGKGERSDSVAEAIRRNGGVYLCALGGAGALASQCITASRVIAYDDLGCESVKEIVLSDFPLIVGIDAVGGNIFQR